MLTLGIPPGRHGGSCPFYGTSRPIPERPLDRGWLWAEAQRNDGGEGQRRHVPPSRQLAALLLQQFSRLSSEYFSRLLI